MSRIGNNPVKLPPKVEVALAAGEISVKGPLGTLSRKFGNQVSIERDGEQLVFKAANDEARALQGTLRALVAGMVKGVTQGYSRSLEINGVGYRANVQGKILQLNLGYSHDVNYPIPEGIEIKTPKPTEITITGIDKQRVGQVAAEIRDFRGPEPYKGKGIKYSDERIFRKEGKKK